ncbi:phosphatase PAP2 family protein [Flagellimonas sp. HMM57]|uniref:phosphatase PAP2 family protein n=1 Tax=unclassified Flagellimonas TaxID=2644544 RepID=UPI0013D4BA0E|nr:MULTISPECIES: phosphatase PAP2 family protein [unclassified Flagellimonas]UII75211.1 phosphatase PAP2 family protein [Flagellimonas sp. HMM57]
MLEEIIRLDKELFLFLNGLGTETWDGFWLFITHKLSAIPLYALLLFFTFKHFGTKRTVIVLVFVALLITATDQLANFFKYGVQRLRPCHDGDINIMARLVKKSCGGRFGYFSAHASNAMALASFFAVLLSSRIKYLPIFLMVWAILVGYSRIYIGVHFPLDVLTGISIGIIFGWLFAKLAIFAFQKLGP